MQESTSTVKLLQEQHFNVLCDALSLTWQKLQKLQNVLIKTATRKLQKLTCNHSQSKSHCENNA